MAKGYRQHLEFQMAFGQNLVRIRKEHDFTQEELAERSGFDLRDIGAIERGERNTGIASVKFLADAFGVDHRDLMNFDIDEGTSHAQ